MQSLRRDALSHRQAVQGDYVGFNSGNGEKISYSQGELAFFGNTHRTCPIPPGGMFSVCVSDLFCSWMDGCICRRDSRNLWMEAFLACEADYILLYLN